MPMSAEDPYTDDSVQGRVDPDRTLQTRLRSEEATGSITNTSEEVAQHLRRMRRGMPPGNPVEGAQPQ
jgi:hypothetical protein